MWPHTQKNVVSCKLPLFRAARSDRLPVLVTPITNTGVEGRNEAQLKRIWYRFWHLWFGCSKPLRHGGRCKAKRMAQEERITHYRRGAPDGRFGILWFGFWLLVGRLCILVRPTRIYSPLGWVRIDRSSWFTVVLGWPWQGFGLVIHIWIDRPYRSDVKLYDHRYEDMPHSQKISSAWFLA